MSIVVAIGIGIIAILLIVISKQKKQLSKSTKQGFLRMAKIPKMSAKPVLKLEENK